FTDALYRSHGYAAVLAAQGAGAAETAKLAYPCNLDVLQGAQAVIIHSQHALQLAREWYGPGAGANWHVVPLPRSAPMPGERAAARAALGIPDDALLVCSFGFVDATKLSHRLLQAWQASTLAADARCQLVFVGANHGGAYGKEMLDAIGANPRIRIAGWTDEAVYHQYLRAADIGVQLRSVSRGETSAAVLDCMNYGLATIVNANGSMAALPDAAVIKLPDDFALEQLVAALDSLRADLEARVALGARAAQAIETAQRPHHSAARYAEVLDAVWSAQPHAMAALTRALARTIPRDEQAVQQIASCLSFAPQRAPQPRQLLVDVTNIVRNDLGTGIERVVRMQLLELLRRQPQGLRIEPVYLSDQGGRCHYRYAQQYACKLLGLQNVTHADEAVDINPGDVFYAPDYAPGATGEAAAAGIYAQWRARGVQLNFLIHDLLPVLQPQFFPPGADANHAAWLRCIVEHADRLVCISGAVADEARLWFAAHAATGNVPEYAVLHHGADLPAPVTASAPLQAQEVLGRLRQDPSFLMVGTIEPRKGHLDALDAFERLWEAGRKVNLVIVGNEGWKPLANAERRTIPAIVARISQHPQLNQRLFWLKGIDDAYLAELYRTSACLLAASEGEGFGLPLIEAAHHGLPVIARDIPVFREVAGEAAFYFNGDLAGAIKAWLAMYAEKRHPRSEQMGYRSWESNAAQLLALLTAAPKSPAPSAVSGRV
ncbi:MAG: glycosyltransferase, partial [Gammaproteobacteria bacterium]